MRYGVNSLRVALKVAGGQSWCACNPLYTMGFSHGLTKTACLDGFTCGTVYAEQTDVHEDTAPAREARGSPLTWDNRTASRGRGRGHI